MNYLAHVYLSGPDKALSIGNFIADHIKGKAYLDYPKTIQKGIILHRKIDHFTDQHPLFRKNVTLLFPQFRHYSRVIVDMFFDHFFWQLNGHFIIRILWKNSADRFIK